MLASPGSRCARTGHDFEIRIVDVGLAREQRFKLARDTSALRFCRPLRLATAFCFLRSPS